MVWAQTRYISDYYAIIEDLHSGSRHASDNGLTYCGAVIT